MIHIGLLGFGTVGQGVYEIIAKHQDSLSIKKILVRGHEQKTRHGCSVRSFDRSNRNDSRRR
jgi:homoserine dehydrogenase